MIKCKITNNTGNGLSLNWVRGGISIPKDSAAVLSYDPFSIMDPNSSIYHGALEAIRRGVVSVAYWAEPPATMIDSLETPVPRMAIPAEAKEKAPFKNKSFNEFDPYHKNEFQDSVNVPKNTKAVEKDDVKFDVNVPTETKVAEKRAETAQSKATPTNEPVAETKSATAASDAKDAANTAETAAAPSEKKASSKKTKKL